MSNKAFLHNSYKLALLLIVVCSLVMLLPTSIAIAWEYPNQPSNISPDNGAPDTSITPTLVSSDFYDPDPGDYQIASQWQVTISSGDYSSPVFDSGTDSLNLTSITLSTLLNYSTTYYWHVRYQGNYECWSTYSNETSFTTAAASSQPPDQPSNVAPANGNNDVSLMPILQSSSFSDTDTGDIHSSSQWQITTSSGDYSSPVFDSGTDSLNLTSITLSTSLDYSTTYYWHISHQDDNGDWSSYSPETSFTTLAAPNQPPVADAVIYERVIDADNNGTENITLNGSGSYDPDGTIVSYEWKEEETTLSTDISFTHGFALGVHTITLTVTDNDGLTDYETVPITVTTRGSCFIATAAYGTPMAEEIDILRDFRDQYMLTNPVGEAMVKLYYNTSPPIADFIAEHPALKQVVRASLEPVIAMSTIIINTNLAQKLAVTILMVLLSTALIVWFRKKAVPARVDK